MIYIYHFKRMHLCLPIRASQGPMAVSARVVSRLPLVKSDAVDPRRSLSYKASSIELRWPEKGKKGGKMCMGGGMRYQGR